MKLWIDDIRPAPEGWYWANTVAEGLGILTGPEFVSEVSFDHDMGGDMTTRPIVMHLAEHGGWPPVCRVHSQNNVGREWIEGMVNYYGPGITY